MDIKAKIDEIAGKVKNDPNLMDKFSKDPVSTVESMIGIDLPNDQVEKIVEGIKAKVNVGKIGDALGGLFGKK